MKKMISAIAAIVLMGVFPSNALANSVENLDGTPLSEDKVEVSVTLGGASSYVGPNDGLTYDKDPAFTASLDACGELFCVGVWQTYDFDGQQDLGDETNVYAGANVTAGGFDISGQITYFALTGGSDAINLSATVSKTFGAVTPYVTVTHDSPTDSGAFPSGEIYRAGLGVAVYDSPRLSVNADIAAINDRGPYGNPKGISATIGVSASYALNDTVSLNVEARAFEPLSADKEAAEYVAASLTYTFS